MRSVEVEFDVLGPLRVVVDGVDVTPTAPKEKSLLALLAVNRGAVVSTERLLDELWPDLAPERGRRVLQVRVAAVRKLLDRAGAAALVESVAPGYRLRLEPHAVDGDRFERLLHRAREAAAAEDAGGAAAMLADAEALWRGGPYADARGSPTVEIEVARLDELRVVALEERLTAELASGRHIEVAPQLEALVAAYPLRERLWERWILALYRCGRQAEALRAYATTRARLRDELGVTPGAGLRQLEAAVLDQLAELDRDPGAADLDPRERLASGGGATAKVPARVPYVAQSATRTCRPSSPSSAR